MSGLAGYSTFAPVPAAFDLFVSDEDPLVFYRAIAAISRQNLASGGMGLVEINDALPDETVNVYVSGGYSNVKLIKDFADRPRLVAYFAK